MEEQILKIIQKVRKSLFLEKYQRVVKQPATVELAEKKGKLVLESICFDFYDEIIFTPTELIFSPEHGYSETLMTYENIDAFLNL